MPDRFDEHLNTSDTTMWRIERDPALRTTILGIAVLDHAPPWWELRARLADVTDRIDRLRQRVVEPPFGGTPRWVEDPEFDLDFHLRRIVAPGPADLDTVFELAGPVVMAPFDRDRPLWEFTLVEGLVGGRAALLQKIHHSATDGVGAVRMARLLFDGDEAAPRPVRRLHPPPPRASGVAALLDELTGQTRQALSLAEHGVVALPRLLESTLRHPNRSASTFLRTTESIAKLVRPVSEPMSPVMQGRGLSRRLTGLTLDLGRMRTAAHRVDGTINDAFLAAIAGGMARYHAEHGTSVDALRVTMPINLRTADDPIGNNRFTPVRFLLPTDIEDPAARMRRIHDLTGSWRREPGLRFTGVVAGLLNVMPAPVTTAVMGSMLKAVDLVATNVPGLERPVSLAGADVEAQYAFAPPSGAACSLALHSYADALTLGVLVDAAAIPDLAVLRGCLQASVDEVTALGRRAPRRARAAAAS